MSPSFQNADSAAYPAAPFAKGLASPVSQPSLSSLDDCKIAVQLELPGATQVLVGHCTYEADRQLGAVLRVQLPASAMCELVIIERDFSGQIVAGHEHGCKYLIRLGARRDVG